MSKERIRMAYIFFKCKFLCTNTISFIPIFCVYPFEGTQIPSKIKLRSLTKYLNSHACTFATPLQNSSTIFLPKSQYIWKHNQYRVIVRSWKEAYNKLLKQILTSKNVLIWGAMTWFKIKGMFGRRFSEGKKWEGLYIVQI